MNERTANLTSGPLMGHLIRLAVPAAMGYFFNTMYNVVDTFWAGRLSTDALASLSLNFPVYMLAMTLGIGFSSAAGALVSNSIGADDSKNAVRFLTQTIGICLLFSIAAAILMFVFLKDIFIFLNSEGAVLEGAVSYGRIIIIGMPFINLAPVVASALSARGDTMTYRNALIAGFILNVGLDPLFMFTFGMDEAGVAAATVLIQLLTLIYLTLRAVRSDCFTGAVVRDFIPRIRYFREILGQAVPASINFLTISAGTFVITWFISVFGPLTVAAYGAAVRVEQIALVPTMGLNMALAVIVGQNNGAGQRERVISAFRLSLLGGLVVMAAILPPVLIFGRRIISLFTDSGDVVRMGYEYLLLQGFTFYSYIILSQCNSVLQGIKKPAMIMWMGFYRQIAAPAGVFYLFCFTLGMAEKGVWRGLILVNWSAAILMLLWTMKTAGVSLKNLAGSDSENGSPEQIDGGRG